MYDIQFTLTVCLLGGIVKSMVDFGGLSLKMAANTIDSKLAMHQAFTISFYSWVEIFAIVILWLDKSKFSIFDLLAVIFIAGGFSFLVAFFTAFGVYSTCRKAK
jgi:hypothetical protein